MSDPSSKRRLPVLQARHGDDEPSEDRPPWHWVGIGTVATFLVWLPLAALIATLLRRMLAGSDDPSPRVQFVMAALNLIAFLIAGFAGGLLVGRFGGRAGAREATGGGATTAAVAWALVLARGAPAGVLFWVMLLVVLATLGGGAAYGGGRLGLRLRPRG